MKNFTKLETKAPGTVPGVDHKEALKRTFELINSGLYAVEERIRAQAREFDPAVEGYVAYAIESNGKRLRPALALLAGGATGSVTNEHLDLAVMVELIHAATLVHDDILDSADTRRGKPTPNAKWGNSLSVLLGDCLFAHALKLAASFPTPEICRAVASATNTVCSGEILQTQARRNFRFTRADYFKVLSMKTGELFALSCDLGALLCGPTAAQRQALRDYGMALGTAYQIYDDCMDLFGTEDSAGKSLGTDLAKGKLTLPMLVVLESGGVAARA